MWDVFFSQLVVGLFIGYWFSQLYLYAQAYARRYQVRRALAKLAQPGGRKPMLMEHPPI